MLYDKAKIAGPPSFKESFQEALSMLAADKFQHKPLQFGAP
jgi:hypothetical protein